MVSVLLWTICSCILAVDYLFTDSVMIKENDIACFTVLSLFTDVPTTWLCQNIQNVSALSVVYFTTMTHEQGVFLLGRAWTRNTLVRENHWHCFLGQNKPFEVGFEQTTCQSYTSGYYHTWFNCSTLEEWPKFYQNCQWFIQYKNYAKKLFLSINYQYLTNFTNIGSRSNITKFMKSYLNVPQFILNKYYFVS